MTARSGLCRDLAMALLSLLVLTGPAASAPEGVESKPGGEDVSALVSDNNDDDGDPSEEDDDNERGRQNDAQEAADAEDAALRQYVEDLARASEASLAETAVAQTSAESSTSASTSASSPRIATERQRRNALDAALRSENVARVNSSATAGPRPRIGEIGRRDGTRDLAAPSVAASSERATEGIALLDGIRDFDASAVNFLGKLPKETKQERTQTRGLLRGALKGHNQGQIEAARHGLIPTDFAREINAALATEAAPEALRSVQVGPNGSLGPTDSAIATRLRQSGVGARLVGLNGMIAAAETHLKTVGVSDAERVATQMFLAQATAHRNALRDGLNRAFAEYPSSLSERAPLEAGDTPPALGSGINATTYLLRYNFTTGVASSASSLRDATAVFKPDSTRLEATAGLDDVAPELFGPPNPLTTKPPDAIGGSLRLSQRAVATARVAAQLGLQDMVVKTEFATLATRAAPFGVVMELAGGRAAAARTGTKRLDPGSREVKSFLATRADLAKAEEQRRDLEFQTRKGQPGATDAALIARREATHRQVAFYEKTLQGLAITETTQGGQKVYDAVIELRSVSDATLGNAALRRQLVTAQYLDALCGQLDRHMGNLFIDERSGAPVVKLIDNDLAFGTDNQRYAIDEDIPQGRLLPLPKVVDADFKRALQRLTPEQLRVATEGLLSRKEQLALGERLVILQEWVRRDDVTAAVSGAPGRNQLSWSATEAELFVDKDRTGYIGELRKFDHQ